MVEINEVDDGVSLTVPKHVREFPIVARLTIVAAEEGDQVRVRHDGMEVDLTLACTGYL